MHCGETSAHLPCEWCRVIERLRYGHYCGMGTKNNTKNGKFVGVFVNIYHTAGFIKTAVAYYYTYTIIPIRKHCLRLRVKPQSICFIENSGDSGYVLLRNSRCLVDFKSFDGCIRNYFAITFLCSCELTSTRQIMFFWIALALCRIGVPLCIQRNISGYSILCEVPLVGKSGFFVPAVQSIAFFA